MNQSNAPAYPIFRGVHDADGQWTHINFPGLTKREHFAGLAMQALLSNPKFETHTLFDAGVSEAMLAGISDTSCKCADALLSALEADHDQ